MNAIDAKEKAIRIKTQQILENPEDIEKIARQHAKEIINKRYHKNFFEEAYSLTYPVRELKRRPFLNIGPGSFRHPHWRTADKKYDGQAWTEKRRGTEQAPVDYYWDIYSGNRLDEEDGYFKVIYTSHVIEHLFPQDAEHLLREAKRLLQKNGTIRIVCPDIDLMVGAYASEDWIFFLHYLSIKTSRLSKSPLSLSPLELREMCAQFLIDWVSLAVHPQNPTKIPKGGCAAFIDQFDDVYDAVDAACNMSNREANLSVGAHVNWFNFQKLEALLKSAGFRDIRKSGHLQSAISILRDGNHFDRTDPEMSLFVEATA